MRHPANGGHLQQSRGVSLAFPVKNGVAENVRGSGGALAGSWLLVMDIMFFMLPTLGMEVCMAPDAFCIPIKAAAKLLTNRALLPVADLETMTWAAANPATQAVRRSNSDDF